LTSRTRTVHFVWNKVLEVLRPSNSRTGEQPNRRTPNTEQRQRTTTTNNDNTWTTTTGQQHIWTSTFGPTSNRNPTGPNTWLNNSRSLDCLIGSRHPTSGSGSNNRTPNTYSNSYSSSWFLTVARYLSVSQDLRSRHG